MIRSTSGQVAGAQVTNATTGAGFSGAVLCYVIGDGGTRALGTNGGGVATDEGDGYYTYVPTAAETDFATVAFQFVGTGAVTSSTTYDTFTAQQTAAVSAATGTSTITCRDLLVACLSRIGVAGQGVTLQAESLQRALIAFNSYVDALAANRLMMYGETRTTWALVPGQQTYALGPGQDIDRARPVYIEQLGHVSPLRYIDTDTGDDERPLTLLNDQLWRAVSMKEMENTLPTCAHVNMTYPYITISLWQVPTSASLLGVLYAPTAMTEYDYDDVISLPPGYRRFLITNVAMELCAEFERTPPSTLPALAAQAKADVERANMRLIDMATDPMWSLAGAGCYNIYSDTGSR